MKRTVQAYTIGFFTLLGLVAVAPVFAKTTVDISNNGEGAHTNVDVHTSTGQNTTCINGKCTTTGGSTGKSTVCINGKCQTSETGNLDVQEGGADVHIDNNSSVNVQQHSQSSVDSNVSVNNSSDPSPTKKYKKIELKKKVDVKKQEVKAKIKTQQKKAEVKGVQDHVSKHDLAKQYRITEVFKEEFELLKKLLGLQS